MTVVACLNEILDAHRDLTDLSDELSDTLGHLIAERKAAITLGDAAELRDLTKKLGPVITAVNAARKDMDALVAAIGRGSYSLR